jgi:hypothetical protein
MGERGMLLVIIIGVVEASSVKPDWSDVVLIILWGTCAVCVKMAVNGLL